MIPTLQKKFVLTAMVAITVLILFLLGAINVANVIAVGNQVDRKLEMISNMSLEGENPFSPPDTPPERPLGGPKSQYDTFLSSNFFVVRFDSEGEITYVDVSRTSSVSQDTAETLATETYLSGKETGKTGRFRYLFRDSFSGQGVTAVFLDTSEEQFSYLRVVLLSGAAGVACWGLMLILVIFLSRRAIRPIVENMEKQKQFVTNAGHEIKTPLAIIQSNVEALELYTGQTKWSRNIKDQTLRLSGLMKNLLTLARLDEGAISTTMAEIPFSSLTEEAVRTFAQPMESKGITLEQHIQPGISLHADPAQMEQLLSILLDNSVKYTEPGGNVWVCLEQEERRVRLSVQNTCQALPNVPPDKLFDRFYRGDSARTQKTGGYGIGLAVAQSIAAANQGVLQAQYLPDRQIRFTLVF